MELNGKAQAVKVWIVGPLLSLQTEGAEQRASHEALSRDLALTAQHRRCGDQLE